MKRAHRGRFEAEQDGLHHVADQAALEFFRLAGSADRVLGVVAELTRHIDALRRDDDAAVAGLGVEIDVVAHGVFGDARGAADGQRIRTEVVRSDRQFGRIHGGVVNDRHIGVGQRARQLALEATSPGDGQVDLLHTRRQRRGLAKMEATGADQPHDGNEGGDTKRTERGRAHGYPATMLTILPGTTITLRTVCPSSNRATAGWARAMASASSFDAAAGTSMVARSLPFTCTA
jgi:hypothetical protein